MSQDAGADRTVSIEVDGVSVRKGFEPDAFAVPTIRFEIESERDQPVELRLVDRIPDEFPMDGVGFHPEYGSESWTAYKNNRVVFETTLDPDDVVETVYGIRISGSDEATEFLTEPSITVTPVADVEGDEAESDHEADERLGDSLDETSVSDLVAEETSGLVREFIRGDRDLLPGIGSRPTDPSGADAPAEGDGPIAADETTSAGRPIAEDGRSDGAADPDGDATREPANGAVGDIRGHDVDEAVYPTFDPDKGSIESDEPAASSAEATTEGPSSESTPEKTNEDESMDQEIEPSNGESTSGQAAADTSGVGAALAAEIESGRIGDDELSTIASALDREPPTRIKTQLSHLQARVSELDAYSEAFARFLDEDGTGQEIVGEMRGDIESVRNELDDVRSAVNSNGDRLDGTVERLDETSNDLADVKTEVAALSDRLESLSERHEDAVKRIDERLDRLDRTLESETDQIEATLEGVREDLSAVEDGLEEIVAWRDQLGEMFSGR